MAEGTYFLMCIFSVVLSKEIISYRQPDCRIEINLNNGTQANHPKLFCNLVCNKSVNRGEKELSIKQPKNVGEMEKLINKVTAVGIKNDGPVECSLVDTQSSSAIVSAIAVPILPLPPPNECGDDYVYFKSIDWCIKISNRTQQWERVPQACSTEGGVFAIVDTKEKDKAISEYMKANNIEDVWIALSDILEEGNFVWIDGTPLSKDSFQSWQTELQPIQPDDDLRKEDCAHYSKTWGYKWNDAECIAYFPYLCEKKKTFLIPPAPLPVPRKGTYACPAEWELNEAAEACYYIGKGVYPFRQANEYCKKINGSLASIPKAPEMKFIQELLRTLNGMDVIWIGLNRVNDDEPFLWIDGSNLTYESWASRQPDNFQNKENCVSLHRLNNYMWNDSDCFNSYRPICKRNSTTTTFYARVCPSGCVLIQNSSDFRNSEDDCPLHSSESLVCPSNTKKPEYLSSLISVSVITATLIIVLIIGGVSYYKFRRKIWSQEPKSLGVGNQNRAMELAGGMGNYSFMPYQPPPFLPPPKKDDYYDGYEKFPGSLPSSPK